jgi:teichoic acid transport system ATP-binding protein
MMSNDLVVKVQSVSKSYRIYDKKFDRVREALSLTKKKYHKDFSAIKNISFSLTKGICVGIIGKNGHGKSTLLKLVSGVMPTTSGQVETRGRICTILELTSNLKSELTGLENIILNLRIHGFDNMTIKSKTKEIESFADIGDFINQPLKIYSSGMKARLGFGIATSSEPDILILDEVLAVGDFEFQQKCLSKINSMRQKITMLFVSHSMNSVRQFCDRVLVIEKGNLAFDGNPQDAVKYYLESHETKKDNIRKTARSIVQRKDFYGEIFDNKKKISNVQFKFNNQSYDRHKKMVLNFSFELKFKPHNLIIGLPIWDENGNMVTALATDACNISIDSINNIYNGKLILENIFNPGEYVFVLSIYDGQEAIYRNIGNFKSNMHEYRHFGLVTPNCVWEINER